MTPSIRISCRIQRSARPKVAVARRERVLRGLLQKAEIFRLKDPQIPNPTRGLAGIIKADEILQERSAVGILIGGVAKECYMSDRPEDYARHKDVDVMVMSEGFKLKERFEGGIDWFLPIDLKERKGWKNGHGVVLDYMVRDSVSGAGLCIPEPEDLSKIAGIEVLSHLDKEELSPGEYVSIARAVVRETYNDLTFHTGVPLSTALEKDSYQEDWRNLFGNSLFEIIDQKVPWLDDPRVPKTSNRFFNSLESAFYSEGPDIAQYAMMIAEILDFDDEKILDL